MELRSSIIPLLLLAHQVSGQVDLPVSDIQNVTWDQGTHHVRRYEGIVSPGFGGDPVSIQGSADVEMVSSDQVRLTPGFHASPATEGARFRAYIDPLIEPPGDLVIVSPNPATHITDDVLKVEKWEKLEVALRLPEEHVAAIDAFFDKYYSNGVDQAATPEQVIPEYDLNPYADDSLQLVMTLTSPSGVQRMKWGFFMREATWSAANDVNAVLVENTASPFTPYTVRFRFSPDEEGLWLFNVAIRTPYTTTPKDVPLPSLLMTGYSFNCIQARQDNNGHLEVNGNNRRTLQFSGDQEQGDETPFFGLGTNMADVRRSLNTYPTGTHWTSYYQRDFETMKSTMEQLHEVGGNFMRMYLMRNIFAPEWVNLGVYDAFKTPQVCDLTFTDCPNGGWSTDVVGNCQYQSWAFDQMLDHAHANNIYIQLCIDPYPPIVDYEQYIWGAHPYSIHYIEPYRAVPGNGNPYDLKRFFYSNIDPNDTQSARVYDSGAFYYWKRKYKYIMSRWGYSVNLPIIEPFNEIDQMLTYSSRDMTIDPNDPDPCADNGATCVENRVNWVEDPLLPNTINTWLADLWEYVEGEQELTDPVNSPLGEKNKLLLMSYAGGDPTADEYHLPFSNDNVDLIDVHRAPDQNSGSLLGWSYTAEEYRNNPAFQDNGQKKPFHHGEFTSYGALDIPPIFKGTSYNFFDNHNISFHNELWATTFSSCFAAGTSWAWERVFFWEDAMPHYPPTLPLDTGNPSGQNHLSNENEENSLFLGEGDDGQNLYALIRNRPLHHHFKPLTDFLNKPNVLALGLFEGNFTPHKYEADGIECIYLLNEARDIAVGWVHNTDAYWWNSYYIMTEAQRYVTCSDPSAQTIGLPGFEPNTTFKISYHPTWLNMSAVPADEEDGISSGPDGIVTLNLSSEALNGTYPLSVSGTFRNHLDTLHSDYAFIIATDLIKSLPLPPELDTIVVALGWDFALYPNPARNEIYLRFSDDEPKDIFIQDVSGRRVGYWSRITSTIQHMSLGHLAKGAYWIGVSDGVRSKTKKLLIH